MARSGFRIAQCVECRAGHAWQLASKEKMLASVG